MDAIVAIVLLCASCLAGQAPPAAPRSNLRQYMARLADLVKEEGPIPLLANGNTAFSRSICQAQILAEQAQYAEAAKVLSGLLNDRLAHDWMQMFQIRIAILTTWHQTGRIELKDYSRFYLETGPHWFHQRTRPIVTLWNMRDVPALEKHVLISSLLEKMGDYEGQALALEAIADLPAADESTKAQALVKAGAARLMKGDAAGAERDWFRVREAYPKTPDWPSAVLKLGSLYKKRQDHPRAIDLLQALVKPEHRAWPIKRSQGSPAYYACLEIVECYDALRDNPQALKYAEMARDGYPFTSFCGTCQKSERQRLAQKIKRLKEAEEGSMPPAGRAGDLLRRPMLGGLLLAAAVGIALRKYRSGHRLTRPP